MSESLKPGIEKRPMPFNPIWIVLVLFFAPSAISSWSKVVRFAKHVVTVKDTKPTPAATQNIKMTYDVNCLSVSRSATGELTCWSASGLPSAWVPSPQLPSYDRMPLKIHWTWDNLPPNQLDCGRKLCVRRPAVRSWQKQCLGPSLSVSGGPFEDFIYH